MMERAAGSCSPESCGRCRHEPDGWAAAQAGSGMEPSTAPPPPRGSKGFGVPGRAGAGGDHTTASAQRAAGGPPPTLTERGNLGADPNRLDRTYGLISLATVLHFRLRGLPCDGEGILPEAFEQGLPGRRRQGARDDADAEQPTSTLMGADRRRRDRRDRRGGMVSQWWRDDVFRPRWPIRPPTLACPSCPPPTWAFHMHQLQPSRPVSGLRHRLPDGSRRDDRAADRAGAHHQLGWALRPAGGNRHALDPKERHGGATLAAWQRGNELAARQAIAAEVLAGQAKIPAPGGGPSDRHQCLADPAGRLARRQLRRPAPAPAGRRRRRVGAVRGRPPCTAARGAPLSLGAPPRPAASCARAWTGSPPSMQQKPGAGAS